MTEEITVRLDAQLQRAVLHALETERAAAEQTVARTRKETADATRRTTAESLNQALRRLRQVASRTDALSLLAEGSAPWSEQVVVLSFENDQASVAAWRNLSLAPAGEASAFAIESAPAIATAVDSKDPVTTFASASQISAFLCEAFGGHSERRAWLFPVVERTNVAAMLVASGEVGEVSPAPLELLCEAAGMRLDALAAEAAPAILPLPNPAFVQIGSAAQGAPVSPERRKWDELSADDKQLHLKAQRAARVRVAEIRLNHPEALRQGVAAGDLYGALGPQIDAARTEFLQMFLSKSPSMVDYLHLEILRSLAHDNDRLTGGKYPGPMV